MKTIGIIGGLAPASTIAYYKYLTELFFDRFGHHGYPKVVIYSLDFRAVVEADYWVPDLVRATAQRLAEPGADCVIAACNSIHRVYDEVAESLPIPWISIVDVIAHEVERQGMTRVGLLGTRFTMTLGFFQDVLARHGIRTVLPGNQIQREVDEIIYGELVRGVVNETSRARVMGHIETLNTCGAEGVILGCTELPLLVSEQDGGIHLFNSTLLHVQKALDWALADVPS